VFVTAGTVIGEAMRASRGTGPATCDGRRRGPRDGRAGAGGGTDWGALGSGPGAATWRRVAAPVRVEPRRRAGVLRRLDPGADPTGADRRFGDVGSEREPGEAHVHGRCGRVRAVPAPGGPRGVGRRRRGWELHGDGAPRPGVLVRPGGPRVRVRGSAAGGRTPGGADPQPGAGRGAAAVAQFGAVPPAEGALARA